MKTIKEQINSLINGVYKISKKEYGYLVLTRNICVNNNTLKIIKEELNCKDIRISIDAVDNLLNYELFFGNITERIKTFKDAYAYCGKPEMPTFSGEQKQIRYFTAIYQMTIICKALNEDWEADWDNPNESKYYPYFFMSPSGFAFYDTIDAYTHAVAGCGSHFHFRTSELAKYAGEQFLDIWKVIQEGF